MDALIKQRGTIKAKLTRAAKFTESELDTFLIDAKLDALKEIEKDFESVQLKIEALAEDQTAQEAERDHFESTTLKLKASLCKIKHSLTTATISSASSMPTHSSTSTSDIGIRLPKLNLPTFSGKWEDWTAFHELFEELVNKNDSISKIQKFYYLRSALTSEAAATIQSFQLSEANYDEAWTSLTARYDNSRLIINHHMKAIFELSPVSNDQALRSFVDTFTKNLRALKAQKLPTDYWDDVMVYLLTSKLSHGLRRQWEITHDDATKNPTLKELLAFLENRAAAAELIGNNSHTNSSHSKEAEKRSQPPPKREVKYAHLATESCPICKGAHFAFKCPTYHKAPVTKKENLVRQYKLCSNCLNANHTASDCKSTACRKCNGKHHTSLHFAQPSQKCDQSQSQPSTSPPTNTVLTSLAGTNTCLPTACVTATDGIRTKLVRMIIDSASQCIIITEHLARSLRLPRRRIRSMSLEGIGGTATIAPQCVATLKVQSRHSPEYHLEITAKIMPHITAYKPSVSQSLLNQLTNQKIELADDFTNDRPIDILLGGDYWSQIMKPGRMELSPQLPPLLFSSFGWLVSGNFTYTDLQPIQPVFCHLTVETQLRQFWELEEVPSFSPKLTLEEQACEALFEKTTTRDASGRYIVKLPFNEKIANLGDSQPAAERQFYQIERRMENNEQYGNNYRKFLHEYEELGHMTKVIPPKGAQYYLPHHAVTRPDDDSKFRVVFNGSKETTTGVSLNDTLNVGPTVQNDLFTILCNFRSHKVAVIADVEKMYRQILVHEDDRRFQQILWRDNSAQSLSTYQLNTVTYGLACAPYLATRCLKQLAIDEKCQFPTAANALLNDSYVDDILSGAESSEKALQLINELKNLANSGQFNLRKWHSNDPTVFQQFTDVATTKNYSFDSRNKFSKALGLLWEPITDTFAFHTEFQDLSTRNRNHTKRELLSQLSKIFDPLGLLAPVVIVAKCLLQQLWLQPITWDTPVNDEVQAQYHQFRNDCTNLSKLRIPRFNHLEPQFQFSIHGFCDASEIAYAACIYIAVAVESGQTLTSLLCAKTRVAPLKTISLPRLELCGASLLARTLEKITSIYKCPVESQFAYSDSTVVLGWLSKPSHHWKTFVANRISEISAILPSAQWRHVISAHNSADIASRGTTVETLANHTLWWNPILPPPISPFNIEQKSLQLIKKEERKSRITTLLTTDENSVISTLIEKNYPYPTLIRIFAYVQRAIHKFKNYRATNHRKTRSSTESKLISVDEFIASRNQIIKHLQILTFPSTVARLKGNRPLKTKDQLKSLAPFLDKEGVLRVGGRIAKACLPERTTHPILLPQRSQFTTALIEKYHEINCHAQTNALIAILRQQYWIVNAREVIRRVLHRCLSCRRLNASAGIQQPTGDLPLERLHPSRPFAIVGLDFGGPISTRCSLSASKKSTLKSYIALFICFTTKAVHIELVSSLTTDAFLAALDRFIGRRGYPSQIFSDNGTNFVGAANKLSEVEKFLRSGKFSETIHNYLLSRQITWQFIPPRAPNFGGLWEAGIKSIKKQLTATLKTSLLTYEEISTILIRIEACLNSRPLIAVSSSPNDVEIITPAHFFMLSAPTTPPTLLPPPAKVTIGKRWRMTQELVRNFWDRWSKEYLTELQPRAKTSSKQPISINDIVLVKDDNVPPMTWPLARITAIHPGADGITRVATVKTATNEFKRPTTKLVKISTEKLY